MWVVPVVPVVRVQSAAIRYAAGGALSTVAVVAKDLAEDLAKGPRDGERIGRAVAADDPTGAGPGAGVEVVARFGGVVTLLVRAGDEVAEGDAVAIVELTKLEAVVTAPVSGRIARLAIRSHQQVAGGDLLLVIA
ncbi:hypothetical protein HJ588_13380 [Flexivirga sp. ID2601S]|uniref:Lipoyl-binding domain-containing protein n=2 Tax=Flexivirga aerilata TaxID=1656889 RepID=A0A849AIP3_9MICO|nr:biotin/lipoyl-containing protein [Flexivirga aerilata]NNG40259.1 hypothetical protein [Flexivirga aerilata]